MSSTSSISTSDAEGRDSISTGKSGSARSNLRGDGENGASSSASVAIPILEASNEYRDLERAEASRLRNESETRDNVQGASSRTSELASGDLSSSERRAAVDESSSTGGGTVVAKETRREGSAGSKSQGFPVIPDDGLTIGAMFGQFKIVRFVGGGGMGHVYEAFDCDLERKVAIKVLPKKRAEDEGVVARFLNEAKSSARLNHENIAQVYLFGNVSGIPYIAFEYVDGVNLRDYVRNNGVLELGEAVDYILQTASALSHAASHGVTHRDVKPSNIIVTPQKRVKLIDMGLARLLHADDADDLTESGVTLGTFDYISPEQAKDPRLADARSDVYSLGCTFYYILTGSPPFPNGTMLQKLLQHQGNEAPDVRGSNPSVPVEIAAVIKKMMSKNPDDRYQTPDLLIKDLLQIVEMLGLNVADRGYIDSKDKERTPNTLSRRVAPIVVAVVLLIAIISSMYLYDLNADLILPTIEPSPVASNQENLSVARETAETPEPVSASPDESSPTEIALSETPDGSGSADASPASTYCGIYYGDSGSDFFYALNNGASLEKTPPVLTDESREELKTYLSGDLARDSFKRVAFGWRAAAISEGDERDPGSESPTGASLSFVACAFGLPSGLASPVFTAYSLLGAKTDASPEKVAKSDEVRIVDGKGEEPNSYATLQSALATPVRNADSVAQIELKFNESLETPSVSLVDKRVVIRASEGFRPTLTFKPSETSDGGSGQRMFLLDSSSLSLQGVNIDFTAPSQEVVSSQWTVFEGFGASTLNIQRSTITVCNMAGSVYAAPLHSNVAFFRAVDDVPLSSAFDVSTPQAQDLSSVFNVELDRVWARGEATLFRVEKPGGRYVVKNSGFNVSGSFLQYSEKRDRSKDVAELFALEFEHIAAICNSCFVRIDSEVGVDEFHTDEAEKEDKTASAAPSSSSSSLGSDLNLAPRFNVKGTDSILCFNDQPLALVSTTNFEWESFEDNWNLKRLVAFDVSAFCRRRSNQNSPQQEREFKPEKYDSEVAKLVDLNAEAAERTKTVPPHLFSANDISNWILNPIHTSMNLSDSSKEIGDAVKNLFFDPLFE